MNTLPAFSACYRFDDTDFIVKNLVTAPGDTLLAEALPPATTPVPGALPVAIKYSPQLGTRVFMLSGRNLSISDSSGSTPLGTLHADFLTLADTGSRLIFMTKLGPWIVDYDLSTDKINVIGERPVYPSISFRAVSRPALSSRVPQVTFNGSYTHWAGPLDESDRRALAASVTDACDRCFTAAAADDCYAAPVLAWYHLLDAQGRVLYRSSPVLVEPDGFDSPLSCDVNVNQSGGSYISTANASLSVPVFGLTVVVPPRDSSDWRDAVRARVFWSRPLSRSRVNSPLDMTFAGTSAAPVLRLSIPQNPGFGSMVMGLLDRIEEKDCDSCVIDLSYFSGVASQESVYAIGPSKVMSAALCDSYLRAISTRNPSAGAMLRWAAPHAFSAATACVDGDMVTWGDITPLNALPQGVSAWATAVAASEPWSALVRVTIASDDGGDDEILSFEESGSANAPVKLSQLISYPHPAARLIEIEIARPSGTTRLTLPLTPGVSSSAAILANLATLATPSSPSAAIKVRRNFRRHPGLILSALFADPLAPVSALEATPGTIAVITPASRSSSSWDFARRHLYIFGSAGIHAVAVSAAMKAVSAHLIDSRSVVSARHVAWSPDGVYALSGRNLLSVGGSRAKVVADSVSASAIGWCGSTGRLYCVTGATLLRVRSPDGSWHSSVLPGSAQYSVIGDGHRLLLCSATHILAPPGVPASQVDVRWQRRLRLARSGVPLALRGVEVHLVSSSAQLTVSLYGDNGSRCLSLIASVEVDGSVDAPLLLPVIFPCPFIYFSVSVEGTVAAGSELSAVNLVY